MQLKRTMNWALRLVRWWKWCGSPTKDGGLSRKENYLWVANYSLLLMCVPIQKPEHIWSRSCSLGLSECGPCVTEWQHQWNSKSSCPTSSTKKQLQKHKQPGVRDRVKDQDSFSVQKHQWTRVWDQCLPKAWLGFWSQHHKLKLWPILWW